MDRRSRGRRRAARVLGVLAWMSACGDRAPASESSDCRALVEALRRATACDPALAELGDAIEAEPDERQCRRAAWLLLEGAPPTGGALHSVYVTPGVSRERALGDGERRALAHLPLPAELSVRPDLRPAPGVPATTAQLDGRELDRAETGILRSYVIPGVHELRLRHAGQQSEYCVQLDACDHLELVAHGARLAPQDRLHEGSCDRLPRTERGSLPATDPFREGP